MPATEHNPQGPARLTGLGKDPFHQRPIGPLLWKEHRQQQQSRRTTHRGDIVGIDVDHIPDYLVRRKGDRIGLGHQIPLTHIQYCCIFADLRAHHQSLVMATVAL